jgi:hypothetical protein
MQHRRNQNVQKSAYRFGNVVYHRRRQHYFINGDRGCIAANGIISTVVCVISNLIGGVGIASKFSSGAAAVRQ